MSKIETRCAGCGRIGSRYIRGNPTRSYMTVICRRCRQGQEEKTEHQVGDLLDRKRIAAGEEE